MVTKCFNTKTIYLESQLCCRIKRKKEEAIQWKTVQRSILF